MKGLYYKGVSVIVSVAVVMSFSSCNKIIQKSDSSTVETANSNNYSYIDTKFSSEDLEVGYDETTSVKISLNDTKIDISGSGAKADGSVVTISDEGVYVISGELSNGRIVVDAGKKNVTLIMNCVNITCSDNAPIFVKKAKKVTMTLAENSENNLSDGTNYSNSGDDANVDGTIFSRSDLTLNGTGKLTINANYKHAIVCKDSLTVTGGEYNVNAKSGGIYGKDSVRIKDGIFKINAGSNGIKSTNSEESEKGYIYIKGGSFEITSTNDGIEAVDVLKFDGGEFKIETGGGSSNASVKSDGERNENWGHWGKGEPDGQMKAPDNMTPPENMDRNQMGNPPDDMEKRPDMNANGNSMPMDQVSNTTTEKIGENKSDNATETESSSAKGLKADKDILISGGKINVDSSDDSLHSNASILISGGELVLSSGDDGVHADVDLSISNGTVTVEKSYEGLEGVKINISGGDITVNASDDGINAGGGSDTGSADRMGRNEFSENESEYLLTISGGKVNINANGDGLDSNGNLIVEGGEIYISGPTNGGNGAIDYGDRSDAWITGGTIVACGSSGMAEGFGEENSTQSSVLHNFSSNISGGTEVKITDSNGNLVLSYTPEKDFQSVVFSCSQLKKGTYTISAGSISDEITINSIVTSNGNNGMGRRNFDLPDKIQQ